MEETRRFRNDPPPGLIPFSEKMTRADSIVIVTPEYIYWRIAVVYRSDSHAAREIDLVRVSLPSDASA